MSRFASNLVTSQSLSFIAASHLAELAIELARQSGEEVSRPLSKEQLDRAFQVALTERRAMLDLMKDSGILLPIEPDDLKTSFSVSVNSNSDDQAIV